MGARVDELLASGAGAAEAAQAWESEKSELVKREAVEAIALLEVEVAQLEAEAALEAARFVATEREVMQVVRPAFARRGSRASVATGHAAPRLSART